MSSLLGISFVILGVTYFPISEYIFSTSLFSLIGELFAIFETISSDEAVSFFPFTKVNR